MFPVDIADGVAVAVVGISFALASLTVVAADAAAFRASSELRNSSHSII